MNRGTGTEVQRQGYRDRYTGTGVLLTEGDWHKGGKSRAETPLLASLISHPIIAEQEGQLFLEPFQGQAECDSY